jgi:hypothetical protein
MVCGHWRDLVLFREFFQGDTGKGSRRQPSDSVDALAIRCVEVVARRRNRMADTQARTKPKQGQTK